MIINKLLSIVILTIILMMKILTGKRLKILLSMFDFILLLIMCKNNVLLIILICIIYKNNIFIFYNIVDALITNYNHIPSIKYRYTDVVIREDMTNLFKKSFSS